MRPQDIEAGNYYRWQGATILALNPAQLIDYKGRKFYVAFCRYLAEEKPFYAPVCEFERLMPEVLKQPESIQVIANKINNYRKFYKTYRQIAELLNKQGIQTPDGKEWTESRCSCFMSRRREKNYSFNFSKQLIG
jgi:hypothetical protein